MVSTLDPGPLSDISVEISGSTLVRVIVPDNPLRSIVSAPLLPAAHSPAVAPEAVLLFAAVIASRKVQKPSVPFVTSAELLTVMVLPTAGVSTAFSLHSCVLDNLFEPEGVALFADAILPRQRENSTKQATNDRQMAMKHVTRIRVRVVDNIKRYSFIAKLQISVSWEPGYAAAA
jgi:hypothetical protein